MYYFSAGEVITFRFDSFLPEENYTTNATIQLHPENNEVVDDIKNAIMDMIKGQLISKCPFGAFKSTKKPTKIL